MSTPTTWSTDSARCARSSRFHYPFETFEDVKRALLVALLIMVAGCGGQTAPSTESVTPAQTSTPTSTASPTPTPTPPDNPYESDPVIITIENPTNRSYLPLVEEAVGYWEENQSRYGEYTPNYEIRPNHPAPDIRIEFINEIYRCGNELGDDILGCAPYPDSIESYETADVQIETRDERGMYTNSSVVETLKHEFGHLHGIEHGEEPMPLMEATSAANLTDQPNATERAVPWPDNTVDVYIDEDSFASSISDDIDDQTSNTIAWFNDGKGTTPDNLTVERVESESEANIVIRSGSTPDDVRSTTNGVYGRDIDDDGALEYYTDMTVIIDPNVDSRDFGWHVGFWLDSVVNPDTTSEPFEDPEGGDRRDWWGSYD